MEQISAISMRAVRVEGVDVWRMVHKTAPPTGCPPGCACFVCRQREAWIDVAEALSLSPQQRRKLVHIRTEYMKKLEAIFQERQRLNLEAVSVMLPQVEFRA